LKTIKYRAFVIIMGNLRISLLAGMMCGVAEAFILPYGPFPMEITESR
jgi:hypothetical protein